MGKDQIHVKDGQVLTKGQSLVDDSQIDANKFKLVMVGRKVGSEFEGLEATHNIGVDVFHESTQRFTKSIEKDEGLTKHYLRHIHYPFLLILFLAFGMKGYLLSYQTLSHYEDYLDWKFFEHVKKTEYSLPSNHIGSNYTVSQMVTHLYKSDMYSVESKTS